MMAIACWKVYAMCDPVSTTGKSRNYLGVAQHDHTKPCHDYHLTIGTSGTMLLASW